MFSLDISATSGKTHAGFLRKQLTCAHQLLKAPLNELSLALVGDERMAGLHERFMNITGSTDVLTFELDRDDRGRVLAGEVVVCVPFAARAARKSKVSLRNELLLYALHGMLHLCGFDDRNELDFVQMHQREDDILKRLGVGPVFSAGVHHRAKRSPSAKATDKRVRLPMPPQTGGGRR